MSSKTTMARLDRDLLKRMKIKYPTITPNTLAQIGEITLDKTSPKDINGLKKDLDDFKKLKLIIDKGGKFIYGKNTWNKFKKK